MAAQSLEDKSLWEDNEVSKLDFSSKNIRNANCLIYFHYEPTRIGFRPPKGA